MSTKWIYQTFSDPKLLTPQAMAWLTTFVPKEQTVASTLLSWHDINTMASFSEKERKECLEEFIKIYVA